MSARASFSGDLRSGGFAVIQGEDSDERGKDTFSSRAGPQGPFSWCPMGCGTVSTSEVQALSTRKGRDGGTSRARNSLSGSWMGMWALETTQVLGGWNQTHLELISHRWFLLNALLDELQASPGSISQGGGVWRG